MDKMCSTTSEMAQVSVVSVVITVVVMLLGPYALRLVRRHFFPQSAPSANNTMTVTGDSNELKQAGRDAVGRDQHKTFTVNPGTHHQHGTTNVTNAAKGGVAGTEINGVTLNNTFSGE